MIKIHLGLTFRIIYSFRRELFHMTNNENLFLKKCDSKSGFNYKLH